VSRERLGRRHRAILSLTGKLWSRRAKRPMRRLRALWASNRRFFDRQVVAIEALR